MAGGSPYEPALPILHKPSLPASPQFALHASSEPWSGTTTSRRPEPPRTHVPLCTQDASGPAWTYTANGADWTGECASGSKQSPIAISTAALSTSMPAEGRANLEFGTVSGLRVINVNGKAIQVGRAPGRPALVAAHDLAAPGMGS